MLDKLFHLLYPTFVNWGVNKVAATYLSLVINLLIVLVIAYAVFRIAKIILINVATVLASQTTTKFDDFLLANKTTKYVAYLFPFYLIYTLIPSVLKDFVYWEKTFAKITGVYIVLLILWIIKSFLNALRDYLKTKRKYSDKPIDSFIQVIMIVLVIFASTIILSTLFEIKKSELLTILGTLSAVIILIFRDTILGFVSSVQVSINDMVRIGDWITMSKFGADGGVIEINLTTVKVQNFDNTITTIPTYALSSDSFQNWRGMQKSEGRRIKRHILIKSSSIRFLTPEELEEMKKIELISSYIVTRKNEIDRYNTNLNVDKSLALNGRNMTNLGLFRKYISEYLAIQSGLNKNMITMCRQLQSTETGVPIEIYAFSSDKRWVNYEYIMADLFDHIFAAVSYFDLEVFELPSKFDNSQK